MDAMDSSIDPMNLLELRIKVEPVDDGAGPSTSPALNYNGINDQEEEFGELSKICRLCGVVPSKPTTVLKIFENECARKKISEKINKYLPIQVSVEDPLPKTICADCIGLLENWDGLVKRTKIIEEKLKEKCRNDQTLPINKPTDTQGNTNDATVPIIENYTIIRDDLHGVTLSDVKSAVSPEPDFASDESKKIQREYIEKPQTVLVKDGKKYGVCDICQKGVMLASWRRHVRSHRSVKSFSCEACGLGFSDGGNLARHARALHGDDRPHTCHICFKKFSRNSHLQDHIKSHFDSREFVCDLCGKASKSSSALRMHKRTHDDYKFHCMYCEAKFKRRAHLTAHITVHTGEKAHECACGKTFRLRSQLTSHARTHERQDS